VTYSPQYADAGAITSDICELFKPPRRIPVSQAAAESVRVAVPSGSSEWDPDMAPYMVEPMNNLNRRDVDATIFVGPARTGKTQALAEGSLAYTVLNDPGDFLMYFPTELNAGDFYKRRLKRLHEDSPDIHAMLSGRAHDNNIRTTIYRHGMIVSLAWPTSSQVSQRDARYVLMSDFDSMDQNVGGEGSTFDLIYKRIQAMLSAGSAVAESSPKMPIVKADWKPATPHEAPPVRGGILLLYNRGHRARWYWQCRECSEWFEAPARPEYDHDAILEEARHTAFVPCPHCGGIHLPAHKNELQLGGENNHPAIWVPDHHIVDVNGVVDGDPIQSTYRSYWVKGCAAAFQPWGSLVNNYVLALKTYEDSGEEGALKTTANIDQGVPYMPKAMARTRTSDELRVRAEGWDARSVPEGVRFLAASADVQGDRFVVQVVGVGVGGERWLVDRFQITKSKRRDLDGEPLPLDPSKYLEDWDPLQSLVLDHTYPLIGAPGRMPVRVLACDSGGRAGVTEQAYDFWRVMARRGYRRRFALVKGDPHAKDHTNILRWC